MFFLKCVEIIKCSNHLPDLNELSPHNSLGRLGLFPHLTDKEVEVQGLAQGHTSSERQSWD